MGLRTWLGLKRPKLEAQLQGGLELISPSLMSGWVFHPSAKFSEVRLVMGPHLIAQGLINHSRPDVEDALGVRATLGFELEIPADFPLITLDHKPSFLALSADGSERVALSLLGHAKGTTDRLRLALDPQFRGLKGHFDGLSPDGTALMGWCYRAGRQEEKVSVWIQCDAEQPRPVVCNIERPGMLQMGHPEQCGFSLDLRECSELAGRDVTVSFDQAGQLKLPQATSVRAPDSETGKIETVSDDSNSSGKKNQNDPSSEMIPVDVSLPQNGNVAPDPDLSIHWQELEKFRQLIDQLDHLVADSQNSSRALPEVRRRSARFRLWR